MTSKDTVRQKNNTRHNTTESNGSNRKAGRKRRIRKLLSNIAPQLAHALGGPLAGNAVERISDALFGTLNATEDAIDHALLSATPEQITALKMADLEFQRMLRESTIEEARIAAADRADARHHQQVTQDRTPSIIGALIILGFFVVLGAMVARRLPDGAETEFSIMLGALATMTAAVVNYFFGSSAGSKEKTRLMTLMQPGSEIADQNTEESKL